MSCQRKENLSIIEAAMILGRRECDLITRPVGFTDWIVVDEHLRLLRGPPDALQECVLNEKLGLTPTDFAANDWMTGFF